jgi:hypothetical protein
MNFESNKKLAACISIFSENCLSLLPTPIAERKSKSKFESKWKSKSESKAVSFSLANFFKKEALLYLKSSAHLHSVRFNRPKSGVNYSTVTDLAKFLG